MLRTKQNQKCRFLRYKNKSQIKATENKNTEIERNQKRQRQNKKGFENLVSFLIKQSKDSFYMITVSDLSLKFSNTPLFKDVNLKFTEGNCYGIIGANGAGKSTFLKILSGEIEQDTGTISVSSGQRIAVLKQDHFAYDEHSVLDTVMMGYPKLYECYKAREEIYAKEDFTEEDGIKASELEGDFAELGGWEAENNIEQMLSGLGLEEEYHSRMMSELDEGQKVRVLLAQAIFGDPDILLLDEPTNGLDLESIHWLEEYLIEFPNIVIVVSHDRHF